MNTRNRSIKMTNFVVEGSVREQKMYLEATVLQNSFNTTVCCDVFL